jgi:cephalosporin hydroxylase
MIHKDYPSGWPQFPILEVTERNDYANYRHMYFALVTTHNMYCIVETGLGNGHSTRIFLEALSQLSQDTRTIRELNTFELEPNEKVVKSIRDLYKPGDNFPVWGLHIGKSIEQAKIMGYGTMKIDLLYIDSLHTYDYALAELNAFKPYLSDKAIIMLDDVWHSDSGDENKGPYYSRNPGSNPSDIYYAAKDWMEKENNGWKSMTFTEGRGFGKENITTSGKMILYKEH